MNRKIFFIAITMMFFATGWLGDRSLNAQAADQTEVSLEDQVKLLTDRVQQLESQLAEKNKANSMGMRGNQRMPVSRPSPQMQQRQWDPFDEMEQVQNQMNQMFQRVLSRDQALGGPGMFNSNLYYNDSFNLKETKDGYEIRFDVAGFDNDQVDIEVKGHTLTISGQSKSVQKDDEQTGYFEAHSYGKFSQTISLPDDANINEMKTQKKDNVFIITLPKKV